MEPTMTLEQVVGLLGAEAAFAVRDERKGWPEAFRQAQDTVRQAIEERGAAEVLLERHRVKSGLCRVCPLNARTCHADDSETCRKVVWDDARAEAMRRKEASQ